MSGCYPSEEAKHCEHGVPMTHPCNVCALELKIQVKYADLNNRINGLHEHKLYQIDENRKISKRVDEIISAFENDVISIHRKIEKLESKFEDFMQKSSLNSQKVPFKCPVCDGKGSLLNFDATLRDCHACEGKGIIWG